jgi:hypothetical protein
LPRRKRRQLGHLMTEQGCYVNKRGIQDTLFCARACGFGDLVARYNHRRSDFAPKTHLGSRGTSFFWAKLKTSQSAKPYAVLIYDPRVCAVAPLKWTKTKQEANELARTAASEAVRRKY